MFGIGVPELVLILIIGLIVFGPGKLPEIGRGLGKTLREFRRVSSGIMDDTPEMARETSAKPKKKKKAVAEKTESAESDTKPVEEDSQPSEVEKMEQVAEAAAKQNEGKID